jgi:hypothetical protein
MRKMIPELLLLAALIGGCRREKTAEEYVRESSGVLFCEATQSGTQVQFRVSRIIYVRPKTDLPYAVGDTMPSLDKVLGEEPLPSTGDGRLVFMRGSPAKWHSAMNMRSGKILGFGNMSIEEFTSRVKTANNRSKAMR